MRRLPAVLALYIAFHGPLPAQQRLEITIEKREAGEWKAADPNHVFSEGDQVRFRFKSSGAGFLYVVNEGTSGSNTTLFPTAQTGTNNKIEGGRDYLLPSSSAAFRVTGPPGHDTVYWILSPVKIEASVPYKPLPAPPPPNQLPANMSPRCDDSVLKARGECVDSTAGLKPNKLPNMQPRELLFVRKGEQSIVSVPPSPSTRAR